VQFLAVFPSARLCDLAKIDCFARSVYELNLLSRNVSSSSKGTVLLLIKDDQYSRYVALKTE
jgi:hypothetical protein